MKYTCEYCGNNFDFKNSKSIGGHKTSCSRNPNRQNTIDKLKKNRIERKTYELFCSKCNLPYEITVKTTDFVKGKYPKCCSITCSHSRIITDEHRQRISNKLSFLKKGNCSICSKELSKRNKSGLCNLHSHQSQTHRDKMSKYAISNKLGGYVVGSGNGVHGWFKGFWCDSSWELAYVIYNLDHGIKFKRNIKKFKYFFDNKESTYTPDYEIGLNNYIEIKGYKTERWEAKKSQFPYRLTV